MLNKTKTRIRQNNPNSGKIMAMGKMPQKNKIILDSSVMRMKVKFARKKS